jgi:hypothetical protein
MSLWKNINEANSAPAYTVDVITGNTGIQSFEIEPVGTWGVDNIDTQSTNVNGHAGWVLRTVGTGGRAGRIQEETLVAMSSMSSLFVKDGLILFLDSGNPKSYSGTGTNWIDLSGSKNNGTLINGPTFNSANNGVIVFDGVNDFVNLSSTISLSGDFTIQFFENLTGTISSNQIPIGQPGLGNRHFNHFDSKIRLYSASQIIGPSNVPQDVIINSVNTNANTWYNYAFTRSGTNYFIYTNGSQTATQTVPIYTFNIPMIGNIGGRMSVIMIYNRALSILEVQQNFNLFRNRYGI